MKLAITSDTHLGDPLCSLIEWNGNDYVEGPKYQEFEKLQDLTMITLSFSEIYWISQ